MPRQEEIDLATAALQTQGRALLDLPLVNGFEVGVKILNGLPTDEIVIRIYVDEEAGRQSVPSSIGGFPVEVQVSRSSPEQVGQVLQDPAKDNDTPGAPPSEQ